MDVTDPREAHEDVIVTRSREVVEPEHFEEAAASEAATAGWVVLGFVFDHADRILLVDQSWADGWIAPGGTLQPGESLAETCVREIREETGVEVTPIRPHAVDEFTFENERTGETDGWTAVCYEAVAETTAIGDDLGLDDEEIHDADWFDTLPDGYDNDLGKRVYERCIDDSGSK